MSYIDVFPFIALVWGIASVVCIRFGESAPKEYNALAIVLLVLSWGYLIACAPLFKEGQYIAPYMGVYVSIVAAILSIEVWFIFISTMLAVGLAKKAHNPENKAYLPQWHTPIRRWFKPAWQGVAIANVLNAIYYITVLKG